MHKHVHQSWKLLAMLAVLLLAACSPPPTVELENEIITVELLPTVERTVDEDVEESASEEDMEERVSEGDMEESTSEEDMEESGSEEEMSETTDESAAVADASASGVEILTEDNRSDRLRNITQSWNTNWERRTIEYDEILSGGPPRDGIPSIDDPKFISPDEASDWLAGNEPVIVLEINGDARAYPLQILTWHEIANDTVGGEPVVVTFCPLCNSALVFESTVNGEVFDFGVSGLLRNSDLIMYDRTTETLWQQFTGEGVVGDLAGHTLTFVPSQIISFAQFTEAYPEGIVLSRDTGINRQYGRNPYAGYDTIGQNPFLFDGELDERLPAVARVVTVSLDDVDIAYPLDILAEQGVINDAEHGLVVFHQIGTSSALGAAVIADAQDVGSTGVFRPEADGQTLTFVNDGGKIMDEQTGSTWNILGQATAGPLEGTELPQVVQGDHFWFSWAAFKPDTMIYGG